MLFADYLIEEKKSFEQATLIFQRLGLYEKAFECSMKIKHFEVFHYYNCLTYLSQLKDTLKLENFHQLLIGKLI